MEPFENTYEVITFITLFAVAVFVIPYLFCKLDKWIGKWPYE